MVLFMTANVKRLPEDYAGACGVIGKPYSEHAVKMALAYLEVCLREGQRARAAAAGPVALAALPTSSGAMASPAAG